MSVIVTELKDLKEQGFLLDGTAIINGYELYFYFDKKSDKFTSSSYRSENASRFGVSEARNPAYLVCQAVKAKLRSENLI